MDDKTKTAIVGLVYLLILGLGSLFLVRWLR